MQITEINIKDKNYPPLLREISNPPERIFVRGTLPDFNLPWIAIVGTRKATRDGIELAKKVAKSLAERGFVIVSGLAMGIDAAAHSGTLDAGGLTAAVLGNGIDTVYPAQNENLANKILLNKGAIISEYEPGTPSLPHLFLARNRIVAGLCVATIVIEAPQKSGALVTARLAAEAGREVFVFPGGARHPQYAGSHALIRDGARLVHSTEDILEDLNFGDIGGLTRIDPRIDAEGDLFESRYDDNNSEVLASKKSVSLALPKPLAKRREAEWAWTEAHNFNLCARERGREPSGRASGWASETPSFRAAKTERIFEEIKKSKLPLSIDKIIQITKLTPQAVNQIITELIINGIVEETSFGYKLKN